MITLQQTAGDNNETIWCLRLRGEGSNLITLGDFSASTGWTANGGWVISGGVATYTGPAIAPLDNSLYRTISAVSAASYIFEYEIISVTGTGIELNLEGGGDSVIVSSYLLDLTLGKHSINIVAEAAKTKFVLSFSSVAEADVVVIDNLSLRLADNITRISSRDLSLDSGSVVYDGQALNYDNYLSDLTQNSTIVSSGGTGSVSGFSFSISRHINNTAFSSFFNSFYPATNQGFLTSKIIDFGVCWTGADEEVDITWLFRGRVIDYSYDQRQLNLVIFQESELVNREVPYYTVQKDFDNGVSYYTNAPEDNYGVALPIIYGSFNVDLMDYDLKRLAPSVCIDKRFLTFLQAGHKLYTQNSATYTDALYKYIPGADTFMVLIPDNGTSVNNDIYSTVRLFDSTKASGEGVKGRLFLVPKTIGLVSDYNEIENILDNSDATNITITDTTQLSVKVHPDIANSEVGILDADASDVKLQVSWQSDDGGNRELTLNIYLHDESTPAYGAGTTHTTTNTGGTWDTDYYEIGTFIASRRSSTNYPWRIDDLVALDFIMKNTSGAGATTGDLKIRQFVLVISDIEVIAPFNEAIPMHPVAAINEGLL